MTSIHIHRVHAIVTGNPTPVVQDGEVIGTSRRLEVWHEGAHTEITLYAEEAAYLALPDDPTLRHQLGFARDDVGRLRRALVDIVNTRRDPVTVALEALGED